MTTTLSIWFGFFAGVLAILISEWAGKGKVLYARLTLLLGVSILFLTILNQLFIEKISWSLLLIQTTSLISILISWFGLRTHLSNSITLNLLGIISRTPGISRSNLEEVYQIDERIKERIKALQSAGYLDQTEDVTTFSSYKVKLVLTLLRCVRGKRLGTFT